MSEKKIFNRLGLALFVYIILWIGVQYAIEILLNNVAPNALNIEWVYWVVSVAPMYCVAFPAALRIMKHLPKRQIYQHKLKAGNFAQTYMMTLALMYIGNIIGNIISVVLTNVTGWNFTVDSTDAVLEGGLGWVFLISVICAPIIEEYLFRKTLIDRLIVFGDESAIVVSSLIFGLMHANITQLFYATAIGLMFGFVYVRTGKVKYSIALHMLFNFMGGFLPAVFMKKMDIFSMEEAILNGNFMVIIENAGALLGLLACELVLIGLGIAGFVLLIINRKKFRLNQGEVQLNKREALSYFVKTPCMLLFIIAIAAVFILQIVNGTMA